MSQLHELAHAAGIETQWRDVNGVTHAVADDTLRAVLAAIGFAAATEPDVVESLRTLLTETGTNSLPLVTAMVGERISLSGRPGRFRVTLESGEVIDGIATEESGSIVLPPIAVPGYHSLEIADAATTIAVAPRRAYTLADAGNGAKLWGLTVQLYSLRRKQDGGIGDFAALEDFCARAVQHGADAIGISPVHALFSADVTRFGPYAPSNRAALNVLHAVHDFPGVEGGELINWPSAAAAKLAALRARFEAGVDDDALAGFRRQAGVGLERHAIFEAISQTLSRDDRSALDWRNWPAELRNPANPAVQQFALDHAREVAFHAWLQYQADQGLAAAQLACRLNGAKIGLIADLAVGTDHAGSASWSRQEEVLKGLEIGAPPDLINREGQSWGITAFSPRGLRNGGFSAFIEMLRHALRHAGGVRIDHVMGLARLWVVPSGFSSAQGAYLAMPMEDLLRLVTLESQRHQAVILGEDLGTLPHGFGARLDAAGIAGLRVMWFERDGAAFRPPSGWTPTAVAMTTTHDLPTTAGWWQGRDIDWRTQLAMQGDGLAERRIDRATLWSALQASGATTAPQPPDDDGAAVTYPAAAHLGRAACVLALLPVEDALSLSEQPNLPGTMDEHPNWRRRLPGDAETLFAQEDFNARLAVLSASRRIKG